MKTRLLVIGGLAAIVAVFWYVMRTGSKEPELEYRYAPVVKGEIVRSITATGVLVALTTVDVKSKAGGIVEQLVVDEGSEVKRGDLIAIIDPRDTQASYSQAEADLRQATARAAQAKVNYDLQIAGSKTSVEDAQVALETARIRLARAQIEAERQPTLTESNLTSAKAQLDLAKQDLDVYERVTAPQIRRDVSGSLARAQADFDAAEADYTRQQELLKRGFVSEGTVERAKATLEAARASYTSASQRSQTLDREITAEMERLRLALRRAQATQDDAIAQRSQVDIARRNLEESRKAVQQAEINLQKMIDAQLNNRIRQSEVVAAEAGTVRSKVALDNAKVQLESTTVVAPRDGVVTMKYLEEGTIIPPGTSTFAQGTSIVQLSDVSKLFMECLVDEADISDVRKGQQVRITTEAFPGRQFRGVVERVNPAAATDNNITAVKVRIEVLPGHDLKLLPGMNGTAEFITMSKPNVLVVPSQAVNFEGEKATVKIKTADPLKPEVREVKTGDTGNNGIEVVEGLKEGDEVVVAEIDIAALREIQTRMEEAQEGGGLAGGTRPGGGRPRTQTTTSGSGSGASPGGMQRPGTSGGGTSGGAMPGGGGASGGGPAGGGAPSGGPPGGGSSGGGAPRTGGS